MSTETILTDFLRDDAGMPLGRGMPSGRPLRSDGESHYEAWQSLVRRDPCAYCPDAGGTVDHIEPRSRTARGIGSVHGWINTVGACSACNGTKRDRDLLWFLHLRARAAKRHPGQPAHAKRRRACQWPPRLLSAFGRGGVSGDSSLMFGPPASTRARQERVDSLVVRSNADPTQIDRLRGRGLGRKCSLAVREFGLGVEVLERFVRREPLYRVHECVFGVLALASEPVDPRL